MNNYPPPPGPPPPPAASGHGQDSTSLNHSSRTPGGYANANPTTSRQRQLHGQVPLITTNFVSSGGLPPPGTLVTPGGQYTITPASSISPHSANNLFSPVSGSVAATPATPMEPYNPRQWSTRGPVSGSQMIFQHRGGSNLPQSTVNATGLEAHLPSPPPPYSPTGVEPSRMRNATSSPLQDNANTTYTASPLAIEHSSPQIPMSPVFPPPPGTSSRTRERSASGLSAGQRFFSLSNLRGKQPAHADTVPQPIIAPQPVHVVQPAFEARPPAARRAASAGVMMSNSAASSSAGPSSVERSSPEHQWQPGMPLPGPPPGPPPPGTRSQSLTRLANGSPTPVISSSSSNPYGPRRRTMAANNLGPVPPTPADFVEGQAYQEPHPELPNNTTTNTASPTYQPLRIDTGGQRDNSLTRRPARRDVSAGLRERRSQSRANKVGDEVVVSGPSRQPSIIANPSSGSITRRREHTRKASEFEPPSSAGVESNGPGSARKLTETVLTPPYTPAVGKALNSAASDRPISHILHTPNEDNPALSAPLVPARPSSSASNRAGVKLDVFALKAMERHRAFIEKEVAAASDAERLELFANYIVNESRLRRDRYDTAYSAMAGDIVDMTRDMWRSYTAASKRAATPNTARSTNDPSAPSWASDGEPLSAQYGPRSASSFGEFTPNTESGSVGELSEGGRDRDRQWAEVYKPSLSPIPSMAVSTVPDENSSRGRTASRWWEASVVDSQTGSIGHPDRITKSRRETKYMGVNLAALQASSDEATNSSERLIPSPGASLTNLHYGPDEYPPEKVGWHESNEFETPMATPQRWSDRTSHSGTPAVVPLDVSRLVTLPPPFPRHHPAVNRSHPELAEMRAAHRLLTDYTEIKKIKDTYSEANANTLRTQQEAMKTRRTKLRAEIQAKISSGSMSFAEAAQAESTFDAEEAERGKTNARANFDSFETTVSHPLNALLTDRLEKSKTYLSQLQSDLESGHASSDPNTALEEGDEHPERLEKLNMLKSIFEAREALHKEMFDFHTLRAEQYAEVILTPYRITKSQPKIDEALTFFRRDAADRQTTFARESQSRHDELEKIIDRNVSRGVEDQLSAFWDIAPGLLEVIRSVPREERGWEVAIPMAEVEENPSYREWPLQYLYSLLGHAEQSAYQFIESQINLLCLLHEVRLGARKAGLRVLELERYAVAGEGEGEKEVIAAEMGLAGREAEEALTKDLKEKVSEVEAQWNEALGEGIEECRERVKGWLEESGGLEDGLDD